MENVRSNKQIWKIAKFICSDPNWDNSDWWDSEEWRNHMYDVAAELLKKIGNNEFTGLDGHAD